MVYQTTGVLSANIAPRAKFKAWNTMIGEGDARELASDLLFAARLVSQGEANSAIPLTLSVIGKNGMVPGHRTFKSRFFKGGLSVQAVFVPDAACAGHVIAATTFGSEKQSPSFDLNCGE